MSQYGKGSAYDKLKAEIARLEDMLRDVDRQLLTALRERNAARQALAERDASYQALKLAYDDLASNCTCGCQCAECRR